MIQWLKLGAVYLVLVSCGPGLTKPASDLPRPLQNFSASSDRITLMTWNLENLYDTQDDPKTNDDTFLPLSLKEQIPNHIQKCQKMETKSWKKQCLTWDWTETVLANKLKKIAQVILSVEDGKGPDVLVVEEVENIQLLERLIKDHLPEAHYKAYLLENNDVRGIDVGLITRLSVAQPPELISLGSSRPALKVSLKLPDDSILTVFGVHFPIASTPVERRLKMLKNLKDLVIKNPTFSIAMGDFNFPEDEKSSLNLYKEVLLPGLVPTHLYCNNCYGTNYQSYDQQWSFLDMILMDQRFFAKNTKWTLDPQTIRVQNTLPFQSDSEGTPADFELPSASGVSDHWPLVLQIVKTSRVF